MADQNGEDDRKNRNFRKMENKISFRIDLESLMTILAIVFASVASLTSKITGKNGQNGKKGKHDK